ncbi:MAG: hypothetical protein ACE5I1_01515, partial [bacterium]
MSRLIAHIITLLLCTFFSANHVFAQNDIIFQVNMRVKILENVFRPDNGDKLAIHGSYNNWSGSNDVLADADNDSIYSLKLNLDAVRSLEIEYKYFIVRATGYSLGEDFIANRKVALNNLPQELPAVFFDNDEVVNAPVAVGKVRFFLDVQVLKALGIFDPASDDTMQVRGPFNGWGFFPENATLEQNIFDPDLYTLNASIAASPNTPILYQFYLGQRNSSDNRFQYEIPLSTGGLRRSVEFAATANQPAPLAYFNDVPPQGVISNGKTVKCTFRIDMATAMSGTDSSFNPAQDNVYFTIMDPWWAATQGREPGVQADWIFADPDGDSVFELTFTVQGPSYYGITYRVAFGPDVENIKLYEGGDFIIHPSRVRYIQPNAANDFPDEFVFQDDVWQSEAGLPVEAPPFDPAPPANKPPFVANIIPNQTIPLSSSAYNIDLHGSLNVFKDPNGDALTFTVTAENTSIANMSVNGSLMTIQPLALGNTTITVKAEDKRGGSSETSFEVTIVEGNQPPRVINNIDDQVLTVDGAVFTINLSLVFEDPNEDPMTFRATSISPSVATAMVFAGVLRVSPKFVGSTTVTVTAEDNRGGAISTTFLVNVISGNQPPRVVNEIAEQTLTVGVTFYTRDLDASPRVFSDPNGDDLSYSANSSDNGIATASLNQSTLTINAVSVGSTTITVFADDKKGGTESMEFTVNTVSENKNSAPQISNAIDNQTLIEGGASFSRNLDQPPTIFNDPDDDPLVYTATSSSPEVAEVTVFGSLLSVAPTSLGNAKIEVVATDGHGGSRVMMFDVRIIANQPPVIDHTPATTQNAGQPIVVDASISDDTGVTSAIIHYRRGGDASFNPVAMTNIGGTWQGTIPGGDITSRGIEYQVEAFDQHQASSLSPKTSIQVSLAGEGENKGSAQTTGSDQTAYRLFSTPFSLHNPDPADVLLDDLGDYNVKKWRFFELAADQSYVEFGATDIFMPGKAFWLIVKESGQMIDSGSGETNSTLQEFGIELHQQWNFIANPYNFVIPITNLRLASNGNVPSLRQFIGSWSDPSAVTEIQPFEGYAIFNNSTAPETLFINPNLQSAAAKNHVKPTAETLDWAIRIIARCQKAVDRDNIIGVSANALNSWDALDQPEPPVIGEFVNLHFPYPEWQQRAKSFSSDIRPPFSNGAIWQFAVKSNIDDIIKLVFDGVDNIPAEFEIWLLDEALNVAKNLQKTNSYTFASNGNLKPKSLRIAIGTKEYLAKQQSFADFIPADFELSQ